VEVQLQESAANAFGPGGTSPPAVDVKALHAKIGELTLENDFLEGALTKVGLLGAKRAGRIAQRPPDTHSVLDPALVVDSDAGTPAPNEWLGPCAGSHKSEPSSAAVRISRITGVIFCAVMVFPPFGGSSAEKA
jgi:hypothetical protein